MKNLSVALNIVLLIAVAFLYYKVYSGNSETESLPVTSGQGMASNSIVFINSDSLLEEYNYFNSLKASLEKKQDSIDVFLRSKAQLLEKEVMNYQERAGGMSPDQRAREEERLMQKQQGLVEQKQNLLTELQDQESIMNDSIHDNLSRYLKEYNKKKNYLYILGYQRGSGILLANDSLDITKEILDGLNAQVK
ncbi:MAG: OmpH family outer membrane protein [Bacteroidetes bacterium]|nr:OmpH family outer membrane protein [Bacteroidota bacterium]